MHELLHTLSDCTESTKKTNRFVLVTFQIFIMNNHGPIVMTIFELSMKILWKVSRKMAIIKTSSYVLIFSIFNFEKYNDWFVDTLNTPYDYASAIHYGRDSFSKNGEPTIEPLQPKVTISQRQNLNLIDILEVRLLYNCSAISATLPLFSNATESE